MVRWNPTPPPSATQAFQSPYFCFRSLTLYRLVPQPHPQSVISHSMKPETLNMDISEMLRITSLYLHSRSEFSIFVIFVEKVFEKVFEKEIDAVYPGSADT